MWLKGLEAIQWLPCIIFCINIEKMFGREFFEQLKELKFEHEVCEIHFTLDGCSSNL